MLKTWSILLLCGLLPFSQCLVENVLSVAQLDKSVLENVLSDTLANSSPLQGLLGGGLLGGAGSGDLVGGLTGGLTGGVLGGQEGGLLGGVLGGQGGGLLGGVLGGQGGGLLGGVLGGQGGGLLGGVLGGEGGLLGLKIVDIVLPKVKLQMLKGFGLGLNIYAKVALHGNSVLGGLLNLVVEVNITAKARLVQNEFGAPVLVVENCKTNLGGIQILSGFLPLNLDRVLTNLLNDVIPGVLCPVVDLVLNVVNILLGTVNSVCPFGTLGKLHYTLAGLPWFNDQHIVLNLNLALIDHEGKTVPFNGTLPALPALPPAKDQASQMLLSGDILSSMLRMLVTKGAFNLDITEQTLPGGAVPLTTSALQSLLPTISQLVPTPLPLVIRIRVLEVPLLSLQDGQATVTLTAAIQVLARTPSGLQNLLGLEAKIVLSGRVIVTATKLGITLSLQRMFCHLTPTSPLSLGGGNLECYMTPLPWQITTCSCGPFEPSVGLKVTSPGIGFSDIAGLTNWITDILRIGYLPWINGALDVGIPFPNLFNLNFADAAVTTMQDALVVGWTPKKL